MNKIAIKASNLGKAYQLGEFTTGTISRDIERWWAKVRGKEDPFLRIGETNDRTTKGTTDIVWSLKDLNFQIQQGDAVGIIGRNGAGKSTLLKLLSRVTSPTTGNVKVRGRIASLLEVGTGFHPELTGRENIFLNGAILGMRKHEIKKHFDAIVDFAGVERYIDTPVKRYSSGMYVRLAFAVAAHLESEILIVDEVLAVGDAEFQRKCLGKMGEVSKGEGRTVLFVSHNMDSVRDLCGKGIVLANGQIVFDGSSTDAIASYKRIDTEFSRQELLDYPLNQDIKVKEFRVFKDSIESHDDLDFKLILESSTTNSFNTVALNIYDEFDQKVAFIDLRNVLLSDKQVTNPTLTIEGTFKHLPLLPGNYNIALHVNSSLVYKDFLNLIQFKVTQKKLIDNIIPYPMEVRGRAEVDFSFKYI
ncbi:ABC transporter ATP-binding protein [Desertivirga brevis]|uniref:ABC transporter ATP-binding protein n=1 Tax=Desertivirga brevis TaxID=2810310 RepID=UPI001F61AC1D|nr:ABC transporter ATP-binding protein [Pedobacter sp. SYSU D00873]